MDIDDIRGGGTISCRTGKLELWTRLRGTRFIYKLITSTNSRNHNRMFFVLVYCLAMDQWGLLYITTLEWQLSSPLA